MAKEHLTQEDLRVTFAELLRACGYDVVEIKDKDVKKNDNDK